MTETRLTLSEATARLHGPRADQATPRRGRRALQYAIRIGRLPATRDQPRGSWRVRAADLDTYAYARHGRTGRPRPIAPARPESGS
jgi:hypothetical protein